MDKELWELEYERMFGEGYGNRTMRETSKAAFKAGWNAAIDSMIEMLEENHGKNDFGNRVEEVRS